MIWKLNEDAKRQISYAMKKKRQRLEISNNHEELLSIRKTDLGMHISVVTRVNRCPLSPDFVHQDIHGNFENILWAVTARTLPLLTSQTLYISNCVCVPFVLHIINQHSLSFISHLVFLLCLIFYIVFINEISCFSNSIII